MLSARTAAVAQVGLLILTIAAIVSMGGGFFAAPVLVVGHWWAARRSHGYIRAGWIVLAAFISAEFAWGITYLTLREQQPYIWLLPALVAAAVAVVLAVSTGPRRHVV